MQLYGTMMRDSGYGFAVRWEVYCLPPFAQYHERVIKADGTSSSYEAAGKAIAAAMMQHSTRKG